MLKIDNLHVKLEEEDKQILKGLSLIVTGTKPIYFNDTPGFSAIAQGSILGRLVPGLPLPNGVVVLCAFDDPNDAVAAEILGEAYPGRTVELVDARDIFAFGGGIHCITQQQPAPGAERTGEEER